MGDKEGIVQINIKDLEDVVLKAIDAGLEKHKTDFYIEPENHYKAHERLDNFFKLLD